MEEALTNLLLADTGVTALVGNRVTWLARGQASALPAIVLSRVTGLPDYTMAGPSGLVMSRVQVDCWGLSYAAAKTAARAVKAALSGLGGEHGGITFGGMFVEGERDDFDSGSNVQTGAAERYYRTSLDFIIWHGV